MSHAPRTNPPGRPRRQETVVIIEPWFNMPISGSARGAQRHDAGDERERRRHNHHKGRAGKEVKAGHHNYIYNKYTNIITIMSF